MHYPQVTFRHTKVLPTSLVGRRREAVVRSTLPYQLEVLKKTGRYDAFKLQWHPTYDREPEVWPIPDHLFWDSDVAKWIEGACYILQQQDLPEIDAAVKDLVGMIRSAQQPDGYLNIHYTVVQPEHRFSNLRDMHELYNAGHLIEAALAHHDYYGNDLLLEPIIKYVDLLCNTFGPRNDQKHGYPGHPEIELALLRLFDRTQDPRHLDLARYFITERGSPTGCEGRHYYDVEAEQRGDDPSRRPAFYPEARCMWYHQAQAPIVEQQTIEGHSVRAMYLLTAVADLTAQEQHSTLRTALYRLWDNMVDKKMYITGGIGAIKQWEGFGQDYYLPHSTEEGGCYSETCAAIGVMMLANRILQTDLDARFGDVMELCLYNAVLTSMSFDGKRFTYVNQLASSDSDASKREDWFTVACCPPNLLRLLGQIGGYIWDVRSDEHKHAVDVAVHLYITSSTSTTVGDEIVTVSQESEWPWKGDIKFTVQSKIKTTLRLRIPNWSKTQTLTPPCEQATIDRGYLIVPAEWLLNHSSFTLSIDLETRWVAPHPAVGKDILSLARGPVIYCVEDVDNIWVKDHFKTLSVDAKAEIEENYTTDSATNDVYTRLIVKNGAYVTHDIPTSTTPYHNIERLDASMHDAKIVPDLHFIPYYFRANRGGTGQMRVGLRRYWST